MSHGQHRAELHTFQSASFRAWGTEEKTTLMARNDLPPIEYWPAVDEMALPPDRRKIFLVRRTAMQMYLTGAKFDEIKQMTGISRTLFYRLLGRVKSIHPDGRIWGLRGLILWTRSDPSYRRAPGDPTWSGPGAFKALLNRHPTLEKLIRNRVLKYHIPGEVQESRKPVIKLHGEFLQECRRLGINPMTDYPFTGKRAGYASLTTYVRQILSVTIP